MAPVAMEIRDHVAVIELNNPPVNALSIPGTCTLSPAPPAAGTSCWVLPPHSPAACIPSPSVSRVSLGFRL